MPYIARTAHPHGGGCRICSLMLLPAVATSETLSRTTMSSFGFVGPSRLHSLGASRLSVGRMEALFRQLLQHGCLLALLVGHVDLFTRPIDTDGS